MEPLCLWYVLLRSKDARGEAQDSIDFFDDDDEPGAAARLILVRFGDPGVVFPKRQLTIRYGTP
jgi:hypothetical protein